MLDYIIKVLLFQTLFLAVYDLVLKRETFFQWNRIYLILTSLIAYVIPLLKFESISEVIPQEYTVLLPELMLSPSTVIEQNYDWSSLFFTILAYIFWIGVFIANILFFRKLYQIIYLIYTNEKEYQQKYRLVKLDTYSAFSFFNYIFLGKTLSEASRQQIITHEMVHVRQKHSLDLLLFEIQKIIFWFNPFGYLFQKRIAELHEFIADSKAIKETDRKDYFQNILAQAFATHKFSFVNPFLKFSLIKKRILMLNKHKSKQILKLKYLLSIPLLLSMMVYNSCIAEQEVTPLKEKSVEELEEKLSDLYTDVEKEQILQFMTQLTEGINDEDEKKKYIVQYLNSYLLSKKESPSGQNENNELILGKDYETDEMSFTSVIVPPIFPGCEDAIDKKQCFNKKLQVYVAQNFDVSVSEELGLESGKRRFSYNLR